MAEWSKTNSITINRDIESNDEFDFGSAKEVEGGSAEEFEIGHKGSSRRKVPKTTMHGGDDIIKGKKTEDELETANSDESENQVVSDVWFGYAGSTEAQAEEKATGEAPIPQ